MGRIDNNATLNASEIEFVLFLLQHVNYDTIKDRDLNWLKWHKKQLEKDLSEILEDIKDSE